MYVYTYQEEEFISPHPRTPVQVIKVWSVHLHHLLTSRPEEPVDDSLLSPRHRVVDTPLLDPADRAEVVHMLATICALREKQTKSLPPVMINIYQAMALLYLVLKDHSKVRLGRSVGCRSVLCSGWCST